MQDKHDKVFGKGIDRILQIIYKLKSYKYRNLILIFLLGFMIIIILISVNIFNNKKSIAKIASTNKVSIVNKLKEIKATLDKDGNRSFTFKYEPGEYIIQGSKGISYDSLQIDGVKDTDIKYVKDKDNLDIVLPKGKIQISNYYNGNMIENIYCTDGKKTRRKQSQVQMNLYKYLLDKNNCKYLYNNAVKLNGGDRTDTCVFFLSEALRKQNMKVNKEVCYTGRYKGDMAHSGSLIYTLLNDGWKIDYDPNDLMPGDLCFSIDVLGEDGGYPTHVYTFMNWEKPNSTENAFIVDNQGYKFNNEFYHIRNVTAAKPNDKFHFFMYKSAD